MWVTGSPPARLSTPGREDENVIELLADMDSDTDLAPGENFSPRNSKDKRAGASKAAPPPKTGSGLRQETALA